MDKFHSQCMQNNFYLSQSVIQLQELDILKCDEHTDARKYRLEGLNSHLDKDCHEKMTQTPKYVTNEKSTILALFL